VRLSAGKRRADMSPACTNDSGRAPTGSRYVLDWPECPNAARVAEGFGSTPKKEEEAMADQRDPNTEKSEMCVMWIGSIVIVLLLLGAMGINMLITHGTGTSSTETSFQSGTLQPK
jgi:hypothetical protein